MISVYRSKIIVFLSISVLSLSTLAVEGERITSDWNTLKSDRYKLPHYSPGLSDVYSWGKDHLMESAKRTFESQEDILRPFTKIVHANGICFKGNWKITENTPYSGLFKKGSNASLIARASAAFPQTTRGHKRSFGLAGKLYSPKNPSAPTANFFLIDDLGGTLNDFFTQSELTNEPKASFTSEIVKNLFFALKVARTFAKTDSHPGIRQLYPISEMDEQDLSKVRTPKWMMLKAATGQEYLADDFREELDLANHHGKLLFFIFVGDEKNEKDEVTWNKIGEVEFTENVVSDSCDHRLHFHHPKWRDNLQ